MARQTEPTEETLIETDIDAGTLSFLDGSLFTISPGDIVSICTWIPMDTIRIVIVDPDSFYPYELTNTGSDVAVRATRLM